MFRDSYPYVSRSDLYRLPKIDRLQRRDIVGLTSLKTLPGKRGQVAWPPQIGRRRREQRAVAQLLSQCLAHLRVDVAAEERTPVDLGADLGQHDVARLTRAGC